MQATQNAAIDETLVAHILEVLEPRRYKSAISVWLEIEDVNGYSPIDVIRTLHRLAAQGRIVRVFDYNEQSLGGSLYAAN